MAWFLFSNGFMLLATSDQLVDFALRVADDRLSRDDSARWIEHRALRVTWTQQRRERWIASLPPAERARIMATLTTGELQRFLDAVTHALQRGVAR